MKNAAATFSRSWNLKIPLWKRRNIYQPSIFGVQNVSFPSQSSCKLAKTTQKTDGFLCGGERGSLGRYQGHFQTPLLVFVWDIFPGYVGKIIETTSKLPGSPDWVVLQHPNPNVQPDPRSIPVFLVQKSWIVGCLVMSKKTSWWLNQPTCKKTHSFSKGQSENKTYLKPPPKRVCLFCFDCCVCFFWEDGFISRFPSSKKNKQIRFCADVCM